MDSAIVPVSEIQKKFGWGTPYLEFLFTLLIGDYGLQLVSHSDSLPSEIECGSWVLGPKRGHYFDFHGKGVWSTKFIYGAIVQYGRYYVENADDSTTFYTLSELSDLRSRGVRYYYEETHIGVTTDDGYVLSKWGRGKSEDSTSDSKQGRSGHLIKHPPHIIPYAYGEVEYVKFSFMTKDSAGNQREILIMPQYLYNNETGNLMLTITDGKKKLAEIYGTLEGDLATDNSAFIISSFYHQTMGEFPELFSEVVSFLDQQSPAIAGMIWIEEQIQSNTQLDDSLLQKFRL